jgi:hypothetical protein
MAPASRDDSAEIVLHARKKLRQFSDTRYRCDWEKWAVRHRRVSTFAESGKGAGSSP